MALIVQKFGGSSVANAERVFNVAEIITNTFKQGNDVVVVLSAQGDTTDDLIEKANEITPKPSKREMDMLLSTGEQISIALMAMVIEKLGFRLSADQLAGWDENRFDIRNARIKQVEPERIQSELGTGKIVLVAGFQGINKYDDITTLGRGGSDTSAVALAVALKADLCQIYTDVDGIYTADPRVVKDAKKLEEITYDEMLELASLGAQVMHNRSVEMAKRYSVHLEVLSSFTRNPGTKIKEVPQMEKMHVSGVASDKRTARISLIGLEDVPGIAFKIFSVLAQKKINVDIILQSIGRGNTKDISFTVADNNLNAAVEMLNANRDIIGFKDITVNDRICKLSIVGAGMVNNAGVAAKMFEALSNASVNIQMISTSEIKISVLIDRDDEERALKAVHAMFFNN